MTDEKASPLIIRLLKRTTMGREPRKPYRDMVLDGGEEANLTDLEDRGILTPRGMTAEGMARALIIDRAIPRAEFVDESDRQRVIDATAPRRRTRLVG